MLFLFSLLIVQTPATAEARLVTTPDGTASILILEPEPGEGVGRTRLVNDSAEKIRIRNPLWKLPKDATGFTGCVLWSDGKKPHPVSQPIDGYKDYVLFLDADITLAPDEILDLTLRCEKVGAERPTFTQAIIGPAGVNRVMWIARLANTPKPITLTTTR